MTPWDLPENTPPAATSAIVIGAGLAGCAVAAALAARGLRVDLLERDELAGAASGNGQGVLYTRLSTRHSSLTDFALQSFCHASRRYAELFDTRQLRAQVDGSLCGSFHQARDREERRQLAERLEQLPELAQVLEASQANERLGIEQAAGGYWFPGSGWLHPGALCRWWATREGITLREHCGALHLRREGEQWQAVDASGALLAGADCAVIATGSARDAHPALAELPLRQIRGQTTELPAGATGILPRAVFCHEGYIAPARDASHCIGATFQVDDPDPAARRADQCANLRSLARAVPAWNASLAGLEEQLLPARVGFRCASPDYLPLVGPVPDAGAFRERYAGLRRNARHVIDRRGVYLPDLYLSTAHGSRGLTSTPLSAELLASQICAEPLPVSRHLVRALSPARFLVRDLGRNRP